MSKLDQPRGAGLPGVPFEDALLGLYSLLNRLLVLSASTSASSEAEVPASFDPVARERLELAVLGVVSLERSLGRWLSSASKRGTLPAHGTTVELEDLLR